MRKSNDAVDTVCDFCGHAMEDVKHMLLECDKYSTIRDRFRNRLGDLRVSVETLLNLEVGPMQDTCNYITSVYKDRVGG